MPLKIGELAKRTGITVRTLHHYDEIGLLRPSGRTPSGHRLYSDQDIQRLHAVLTLQRLGLSLNDIKKSLEQENLSFHDLVAKHLVLVEAQLKEQHELHRRLLLVQQHSAQNQEVSVDEMIQLIEVMVMYEKYYTEEQINSLKQREASMSQEEQKAVEKEWEQIFADFKKAYKEGKKIDDPKVVKLAKRSIELIDAFTGGDPNMQDSFYKMYETEGGSNVLAQHGMDVSQEVFEYLSRAMGQFMDHNE